MTLQKIEQWMSGYYQSPQPESIPLLIESLSAEGVFRNENAIEQVLFFLAFIFRANPEKVVEWISPFIAGLTLMEKEVLITALWISDTRTAGEYLARLAACTPDLTPYINELQAESPPDPDQIPVDKPAILDILWAVFMATGQEKYIIRIISALTSCKDTEDVLAQLIRDTAMWSLKSNAAQHKAVKAICIAQIAIQPPDVSVILQEIIAE